LKLKYVVVTSVTRDDLLDGGASQFAKTICEIRKRDSEIDVEVLTPDYHGDNLKTVIDAGPTVFNHNIETVERLSCEIRIKADYHRSLEVLKQAVELSSGKVAVKSGLMVGMGETDEEVETTICEIRKTGATLLTIGQYLPPSGKHWTLDRYVEPAKFAEWKEVALELGFKNVASGPLVRSSYHADELH
jgi:lipoic acid synthetase